MTSTNLVAFFGGSFDPPHRSHAGVIRQLLQKGPIDSLVVVPVFAHAFEKQLTPFVHRLALSDIAFADIPGVSVSALEQTLPVPNYTLHSLRALQEQHPNWQLRLVVGSDVINEKDDWHDFDGVVKLAPLLAVGREGAPADGAPDAEVPAMSSSKIRAVLSESYDTPELGRWLDAGVLDYIRRHGLYR